MSADAAKAHIVLVEDNPADAYLLKLALEQNGIAFEMVQFQRGEDALLALSADNDAPVPDLILLDLNTPRIDGFEVLAGIRENPSLAGVPVAIFTSSSSPADKHRAALLGSTAYIPKPTQLAAFLRDVGGAVKELLARP